MFGVKKMPNPKLFTVPEIRHAGLRRVLWVPYLVPDDVLAEGDREDGELMLLARACGLVPVSVPLLLGRFDRGRPALFVPGGAPSVTYSSRGRHRVRKAPPYEYLPRVRRMMVERGYRVIDFALDTWIGD